MKAPAATRIYATSIVHARRAPLRHSFRHRSHTWLVDLDDVAREPPVSRVAPVDADGVEDGAEHPGHGQHEDPPALEVDALGGQEGVEVVAQAPVR